VTIGTMSPRARNAFAPLGESLGELLKLGALLLFGALLGASFLVEVGVRGWAFAALALAVARPLSIELALFRSGLGVPERLVAGWFGPKGFASVVYGLLVAHAGLERGPVLLHAIGATVVLSIIAHSSTDVPVARWFRRRAPERPA
jgi:NhaP-type Na+/H+ or K+/H+ antiporter